jgi:outer membrane translocation and assembly module TamA
MANRIFVLGLLLAAVTASPATFAEPTPDESGGGVDWVLKRAARVFTSDNKVFGQVHFPVIATNPNAGMTYGVLPVWLVPNSRHEIVQIFAPMFTYNHTYGASFSGTYYYYPSGDEKLRALLEKSQRSNQRAAAEYDNRSLFGGRATLLLRANFEADGGARFYGLGPDSTKNAEASERLLEKLVRAEFGVRFWESYVAAAGWQVRHTEVQAGPFSEQVPLAQDVRTKTSYSLPRLTLSRDTRDLAFTPTSGSLSEVFAEYSAAALGSSTSYEHYGGQWRFYTQTATNLVTVLHAQTEWSGGGDVPFTALSALGGSRSLRGYAEGRFQDRGSVFANVEERWRVHSIDLVHSLTEFQIAPFLDAGTVFPSPGRAQARLIETVAGVAMRAVVKPDVVGKVEVGVGREGPAVYVGIDYPF